MFLLQKMEMTSEDYAPSSILEVRGLKWKLRHGC